MRRTSGTFTSITINGQTYSSVDEMPPDIRRQYEEAMARLREDKNNNGIPDFAEQGGANSFVSYTRHEIDVTDDLPPQVRRIIERAAPDVRDESDDGVVSYRQPLTHDPIPRGGITVHFTWATLVAIAFITAVVCAIVWSLMN